MTTNSKSVNNSVEKLKEFLRDSAIQTSGVACLKLTISLAIVLLTMASTLAQDIRPSLVREDFGAKEAFEHHHDTVIRYFACNQNYAQPINIDTIADLKWEATWDGNRFMHKPGPGSGGGAHPDSIMRYLTWDGTCWEASWDANHQQFIHTRVDTKAQHSDKILNYLTWDRTKWTTTRDGNQFYHIYVAGAENEIPWEKRVVDFVNKVGKVVEIVIKAWPAK